MILVKSHATYRGGILRRLFWHNCCEKVGNPVRTEPSESHCEENEPDLALKAHVFLSFFFFFL
jgi:hypothetical protein